MIMTNVEEVLIGKDYTSLMKSEKVYETGETVPIIRKKAFRTTDYLRRVERLAVTESPGQEVLPLNCRYFQSIGDFKVLVIEEDPKVRTIKVDISMESTIEKLKITGKLKEYGFENLLEERQPPYLIPLSFPYLVFIVSIFKDRLLTFSAFYRLSPITSLSDYLLVAGLPNIDSSHYVCLRNDSDDDQRVTDTTMCNIVDKAVERFWLNSFNVDYIDHYLKYQDVPEVCDFLTWNHFTQNDPLFIFDVDWIRHPLTLGQQFERICHDINFEQDISLDHKKLCDLFLKEQKVNIKNGEHVKKLVSSECESIFLQSRELSIGESLKLKSGKEVHVYSFFGQDRKRIPSHIQVEENDGRLRVFKLTDKMLSLIEKQLNKTKFLDSIQLSDGTLIKNDDIVEVNFPLKSFRKVNNIRVSRDNRVEVKLARDFYLAESLKAKVIDSSNLSIGGIKLVKDRDYLISSSSLNKIFKECIKGKFVGANCRENYSRLFGKFLTSGGHEMNLNVDDDGGRIVTTWVYEMQTPVRVSTYRVGTRIFTDRDRKTYLTSKEVLYQSSISCERSIAKRDIIKDGEIEIKSFDLDINFKIDDEVVYVDWADPVQMTNPYKIVGFTLKNEILYIKLKNNNSEQEVPYIYFQNGIIDIGKIRKVSRQFDGVVAGSKIRAKEAGISGFPKKDVNIIVGFITDTGGLPLVLCSNYCTLWPFDLEKFEIIPKSSKRWSRLRCLTPQLSKFKFQSGDLYTERNSSGNSLVYLITSDRCGNLYRRSFENQGALSNYYSNEFVRDNVVGRYGIYTPRYTHDQLMGLSRITGLPNLHGLFTECTSELYFRIDERVLNV